MIRSLSTAIAALRNHQLFMDVVANNISNVNTPGFKASRVSFQDMFSQTIRGASPPRPDLGTGGLNPIQFGSGVMLGAVDTLFTQGIPQDTGKLTDAAIQGAGFFVLHTGSGYVYTRDGSFDVGLDGSLVSLTTGMKVLGWQAAADGTIDTSGALTAIEIPFGENQARATTEMILRGNLNAGAVDDPGTPTNETATTVTLGIYDSLGNVHNVTVTFTKSGTNTWQWNITSSDTTISTGLPSSGTIRFNGDGSYDAAGSTVPVLNLSFSNGAANSTVTLDLSNINQVAGTSSVTLSSQDGLPAGTLSTFTVTRDGQILGAYTNGLNRVLGKIALASFTNPSGLVKMGQSLFAPSSNSGVAQIGEPGQNGRGELVAGALEASNVDLAQQFTNMIIAERGFQANSRVITASDEMLQELVNLKR